MTCTTCLQVKAEATQCTTCTHTSHGHAFEPELKVRVISSDVAAKSEESRVSSGEPEHRLQRMDRTFLGHGRHIRRSHPCSNRCNSSRSCTSSSHSASACK